MYLWRFINVDRFVIDKAPDSFRIKSSIELELICKD